MFGVLLAAFRAQWLAGEWRPSAVAATRFSMSVPSLSAKY